MQLWLHIAYIKLKCVKSQASPDTRPLSSQASPDPCPLSSQASPPLILTFVQKVILLLIYRNKCSQAQPDQHVRRILNSGIARPSHMLHMLHASFFLLAFFASTFSIPKIDNLMIWDRCCTERSTPVLMTEEWATCREGQPYLSQNWTVGSFDEKVSS